MLSVYVALDDIGDRYGKSVFNDNDFAMINETAITENFDVFSDPRFSLTTAPRPSFRIWRIGIRLVPTAVTSIATS